MNPTELAGNASSALTSVSTVVSRASNSVGLPANAGVMVMLAVTVTSFFKRSTPFAATMRSADSKVMPSLIIRNRSLVVSSMPRSVLTLSFGCPVAAFSPGDKRVTNPPSVVIWAVTAVVGLTRMM